MSDRVDEIRARLEAATPGPWEADVDREQVATASELELICQWAGDKLRPFDIELIAHAPSDLAFLLDEVARLRGVLERVLDAGWEWTDEYEAAHTAGRAALGGTDD